MWPFKNTRKLASSDEFPAVIDAIRDKLRSHGLTGEADRIHTLVHQMAWTTSNELYEELSLALGKIRKERRDLPTDIAVEIRRIIKASTISAVGDDEHTAASAQRVEQPEHPHLSPLPEGEAESIRTTEN